MQPVTLLLLPPPAREPRELARQAMALAPRNPLQARDLLGTAARGALRDGDRRTAALILHHRAALSFSHQESPVPDLAMAARLLDESPEERALVLLDLGHALVEQQELSRALLTLRESERLARRTQNYELAAAARYELGKIASEGGEYESARLFLREAGQALIYDVERALLATLRDMGNLPHNPRAEAERARRKQAVEEELAALKREMKIDDGRWTTDDG